MQHMMNQMLASAGLSPTTPFPPVDVHDDGTTIRMRADLPGVDKKDIYVDVRENEIQLQAESKQEEEGTSGGVWTRERHYGKWQRSIPLPARVKPDQAKAELKDGVLCLTVPKAEPKASQQRIRID
jgi:HSP20 family protein